MSEWVDFLQCPAKIYIKASPYLGGDLVGEAVALCDCIECGYSGWTTYHYNSFTGLLGSTSIYITEQPDDPEVDAIKTTIFATDENGYYEEGYVIECSYKVAIHFIQIAERLPGYEDDWYSMDDWAYPEGTFIYPEEFTVYSNVSTEYEFLFPRKISGIKQIVISSLDYTDGIISELRLRAATPPIFWTDHSYTREV
jgi:hypothetical protein